MEENAQRLIEWDENKNRLNKSKHGVDFNQAAKVVRCLHRTWRVYAIDFCPPRHEKREGEIFMSSVRVVIREPLPPTDVEIKNFRESALKELAELSNSDDETFCDEDCPELTDEQLARLMPVHVRQNEFRLTAR